MLGDVNGVVETFAIPSLPDVALVVRWWNNSDESRREPGCLMSRCPRNFFGASRGTARVIGGGRGGSPDPDALADVGQDAGDLGEAGAGRSCPWPGGRGRPGAR